MREARFKLTNASVVARCLPPASGETTKSGRPVTQKIYWDAEDKGFGILVGTGAKTFVAQKDIAGRTVRHSIGRFPTWTADQARKRAKEVLVMMDNKVDPNAAAREAVVQAERDEWKRFTVDQAITAHQERMRKAKRPRSERSITDLRRVVERYCGDWLRRPIAEISGKVCEERHNLITDKNGPVAANALMRAIRAVYNTALKKLDDLPARNPVMNVNFNPEQRVQSPIAWENLPAWWQQVRVLDNRVRVALQMTLLFTGLRSTDARTIRWAEIDFAAGTIFRPKPKGGRAFTVPLPRFLLRVLARHRRFFAKKFGEDCPWVFPTRNREGLIVPVQEPKEQRYETVGGRVRKAALLPSPHRLRDTFSTAAYEAGVDMLAVKTLMNHRLPGGDVTHGYIRPSDEHLRMCANKVAAFLLARKRSKVSKGKRAA